MYYAYVLRSIKTNKLYIGATDDLRRRLVEHNSKKNFSTKPYAPYEVIYYEALPTFEEALVREKFYKSGRGKEVLKQILFKSLINLPS